MQLCQSEYDVDHFSLKKSDEYIDNLFNVVWGELATILTCLTQHYTPDTP